MKTIGALLIAVALSLACEGNVQPTMPPAGDDLATAPLGGEYYGEATLLKNTCENPDPASGAFDPFPLTVIFFPENKDQTSLTFSAGTVALTHIMPVWNSVDHYLIDYQTVQKGYYTLLMKLTGTAQSGEMNLELYEGAYEGVSDDNNLGDLSCEAAFKLHLKKTVNYPYVDP